MTQARDEGAESEVAGEAGPWAGTQIALIFIFSTLVGALTIPPLFAVIPTSLYSLDPSWALSLGVAIAAHMQFGTQYVFTYGPLGFASSSYQYPSPAVSDAAAGITVAGHLVYPLAFVALAYGVARRDHRRRFGRGGLVAIALAAAYWSGVGADLGHQAEMISLIAMVSCLLWPKGRAAGPLAATAGLLIAVAALFKVDFLWVGAAQLFLFVAVCRLNPGRPRWSASIAVASFAVSYLLMWVGTGQHLGNLPAFWTSSWQLSIGYSAAMSLGVPWVKVVLVGLCVFTGILIPLGASRHSWRLSPQCSAVILATPFLFTIWKDGVARIGGGGLLGARSVLMFSGLLGVAWLAATLARRARTWSAVGPAAATALAGAVVIAGSMTLEGPPWLLTQIVSSRPAPVPTSPLDVYLSSKLLASLKGESVAPVPWAISAIVENHLRWDPMPVPQTYSAYTPYLDALNARELQSKAGARRLLVSFTEIDGRYLLWDPPDVWRTILSQFACTASDGLSAVLTRTAPRRFSENVISASTSRFGHWIPVPATRARYEFVDFRISGSPVGEALGAIFRQTPVFANIRLSDGEQINALRVVASTARDGLYVSHFVDSPDSLCAVLAGKATSVPRITAVELFTSHPVEWTPAVPVRFRALG